MKKVLAVLFCSLPVSCFAMENKKSDPSLKQINTMSLYHQTDAQIKIAQGVELLAITKAAKTCLQLESSPRFNHLIPQGHCEHIIKVFIDLTEKNNS